MEKKQRPYNTIITLIGDTFVEGERPTEQIIDLAKASNKKLVELSKEYPQAVYEQVWRAINDELED
jgi:hypothetical protein